MDPAVSKSVLNWLNTFECVSPKLYQLDELADGVAIFSILNKIAPSSTDGKYIEDSGHISMSDMTKNINTLVRAFSYFYKRELGVKFDRKELDVNKIVQEKDELELLRLCEYTLGVALGCKSSDVLMQHMMELSEVD